MSAAGATESSRPRPLVAIYAIVIVAATLIVALSIPVALYVVFFTQISTSLTSSQLIRQLYFYVGLTPIFVPLRITIGTAFVGYYALYAALMVIAALQAPRIGSALKEAILGSLDSAYGNPLSGTILLFGALEFSTYVLDTIQSGVGIQVGSLSGDPLQLFLAVIIAPLAEETGFRLALIGIPVCLVCLWTFGPSRAVRCLWRPSAAWQAQPAVDGTLAQRQGTFLKILTYFLLGLSSVLFGLGHYLSGAGWGLGKITEATVAGLFLGYAYIRYGFHTNILMHWSVNTLVAYDFLSQAIWNIPWDSNTGSLLSIIVEKYLVIYALGAPSFAYMGYKFLKRVFRVPPSIHSFRKVPLH